MFILEGKNLTYSSPDGYIKNVNLNLKHSEIHAFIIKNSSEQKVFLESIMKSLENPSSQGEIWIQDQLLTSTRVAKSNIAILHQKPLLIKNFSIAENLNFTNIPKRRFIPFVDWGKTKRRAKEILAKLDFPFDVRTKVRNLSDEDKRLIYITSVILQNPKVIIMHEPMEGLSPKNATKLYNITQLSHLEKCSSFNGL